MPESPGGPAPARPWDAATYDRIAAPQERWGLGVVDRLNLTGTETVLDAGCGTGRVTQNLLERLPGGRVIALDADANMLSVASRRLTRFGGRVTFVQADLGHPIPVAEKVDAVLSTATFHWVLDHDALFAHIAAVLRPGGRLEAQCGGPGNIARLKAAVRRSGVNANSESWLYATPEATEARLAAAEFVHFRCWLEDQPTYFDDQTTFEDFLAAVCLRPYAEAVDAEYRGWVHQIAVALGDRRLDHVRLNISAIRS